MMTKNRFTYILASKSKCIGSFFLNGTPLTIEELCDRLNKQEERIQELESQMEFWKSDACSVSNENSILHNELDIAMSQGYTLTDAFREYIESKREVVTDD